MKQIQSKLCPGPSHEGPLTLVVEVDEVAYQRWLGGAYIQDVFPDLSRDDRERFISGYCTPCWDRLFPEEEEVTFDHLRAGWEDVDEDEEELDPNFPEEEDPNYVDEDEDE